ncbi:MAG: 3-deoxy-D-manno-octulosonic acid transferase [Chlamydiales bacterium]
MKPFFFFYDLLLHLYAAASLPQMGLAMLRVGKYRTNFLPRLGQGFPEIKKGNKRLIWVHAVSVGETKAIAPLIKQLKNEENLIILSTATETGHQEGKRSAPEADWHVYLPFDLSYIIRPIVKRVRPDMVIITETDFWYNFQSAAKSVGAKLILVNGKLSERSLNRFLQFPLFAKNLIHPIDFFCLQGDLYANRFRKVGVAECKMRVTGNLKLDGAIDRELLLTREKLRIDSQPILTLGSTHDPEEKLWIIALKNIWRQFPSLKVFLVPRHPERFDVVARLLEKEEISFHRFSKKPYFAEKSLLLIDGMGLLKQCYQLSTLAFVGGSLTARVGGHNILEPAYYGVPVLYGPHMKGQPDLLDLMTRYIAGVQVDKDLAQVTKELLIDEERRRRLGERGLQMVAESQGALEETLNSLREMMIAC